MVGQTSQTVELERRREAAMFKLYEELTKELDDYFEKVLEAERVVNAFANRAANEDNAFPNEMHQRQQTYFYRGLQK